MRLNFNGQILNGTTYTTPISTLVNGAAAVYLLDASTNSGTIAGNMTYRAIAYDLFGVTSLYSEYVYKSVRFEWVPFVSPGATDGGSQMYISYVDNPEVIAACMAGVVPTVFNVSKNARNTQFFNAWERFVYNVPLTNRRKTFDVNQTELSTDVNIDDRSVQGAVVVGATSSSAAATLGQWRVTYSLELRNLNPSTSSLT